MKEESLTSLMVLKETCQSLNPGSSFRITFGSKRIFKVLRPLNTIALVHNLVRVRL